MAPDLRRQRFEAPQQPVAPIVLCPQAVAVVSGPQTSPAQNHEIERLKQELEKLKQQQAQNNGGCCAVM